MNNVKAAAPSYFTAIINGTPAHNARYAGRGGSATLTTGGRTGAAHVWYKLRPANYVVEYEVSACRFAVSIILRRHDAIYVCESGEINVDTAR